MAQRGEVLDKKQKKSTLEMFPPEGLILVFI